MPGVARRRRRRDRRRRRAAVRRSPCWLPPSPPAPSSATAEFGRGYIQASAYGAEARFGLRPPIGYLAGLRRHVAARPSSALVLAAARARRSGLGLGIVCVVVAAAGLALLPRRWHQLSRRWLVLVPAGIVVHDPVVLADTLMLPRRTIAGVVLDDLGAARQTAADLTGPTPGLAVEIRLAEPATAVLAPTPAHGDGTDDPPHCPGGVADTSRVPSSRRPPRPAIRTG